MCVALNELSLMENKKTYQPQKIEQALYQNWEEQGYFKPSGDSSKGNYCIMLPPPNVTGSLHMGHAFQHTIMDILIRYQRMKGQNTLWQVGTDHAGIATQMVVERQLEAQGQTSHHDLGRDAFLEKVWDWKAQSGGNITQQMRRLGVSADWDKERFTMDEGFSKAVQEVFVRLHEDGLIYRGKRLVNWDPKLGTAISDLEVNNVEKKGHMWHIRYPLADDALTAEGKDYLVVATTRPETLLGDSAVAINPEDSRFNQLIGQEVILPIVNRRIPIIADEHADMEKGSGCVKITPAHDFNDYEVGQRHQLPMYSIFTKEATVAQQAEVVTFEGKLTDEVMHLPEAYQGLDRFKARKVILEALTELGLLEKTEDHTLMIPYGDRGGVVIEPLLTDQWYVAVAPLAKTAQEAVASGEIKFVPQQYENMYNAWMDDIQDWCISRQLWWGHRIPAWYDDQGQVYVGRDEAHVREKHQLDSSVRLTQDNDVLDTWFSSALWTFGTLGWPENTPDLQKFHPTDVLVTGFDIIFFWVARMIMMTMYFVKDEQGKPQVPFKTVYVTGLIRDEQGQKMSKSKGNVIDPLDMIDGIELEALVEKRTGNLMQPKLAASIEKQTRKAFSEGIVAHGTDALRFTLASLASTGRDINWDMNRLEGYRNFCNKLFQASNYVMMNTEDFDFANVDVKSLQLSRVDQWIRIKLDKTIIQVEQDLAQYRFDLVAQTLYDFTWNEFCAWYLELTKPVLKQGTEAEVVATRYTLLYVLENLLRLMHPMMPYITESLWLDLQPLMQLPQKSIMQTELPQACFTTTHDAVEEEVETFKQWISAIRAIRAEYNIAPSKPLSLMMQGLMPSDESILANQLDLLKDLARLDQVTVIDAKQDMPLSVKQLVGSVELMIPMADFIDVDAEKSRVLKQREKLEQDIKRIEGKLNNANFVAKAPVAVVEKEKAKCHALEQSIEKLNEQLQQLDQVC